MLLIIGVVALLLVVAMLVGYSASWANRIEYAARDRTEVSRRREYKSQAYAQSRIIQGYISSARGRTVRVRIRDGRGYLTIKGSIRQLRHQPLRMGKGDPFE